MKTPQLQNLPQKIASFLLLFALPLWYSSLTRELSPQKDVVFALGLLFAASSAQLKSAAVLLLGALLSLWMPQGAHEVLPFASLPLLVVFFQKNPLAPRSLLWWSPLVVALLAALQGVGVPLFTGASAAFSLPYQVLTGTLGNPNYLSLFLLLFLALGLVQRPLLFFQEKAGLTPLGVLWLVLSLGVILWARSYLGWLGLLVGLFGIGAQSAKWRPLFLVGALLLLLLVLWRFDSFGYALSGRLYLAKVHLFGLSPAVLLQGIGPGAQASAFLHWQAGYLQTHPEEANRWSYPEYAHNDLIAVVITWGVPLCLLAAFLIIRALQWKREVPHGMRIAVLLVLLVSSLGATVLYISPVLVVALAVLSSLVEPRVERASVGWAAWLCRMAAVLWVGLMGARAVSDYLAKEATEAAIQEKYPRALSLVKEARSLPFLEAQLLFLQGRILLSAGSYPEAAKSLQEASQQLPHKEVFKALAVAYEAQNDTAGLSQALSQWRLYAPKDPDLRLFEGR